MLIYLEKHYRNANGVHLRPGTHDVSATLGRYLVDNGHAVERKAIAFVADAPEPPVANVTGGAVQMLDDDDTLHNMTRADLLDMARARDLDVTTRSTKAELIDALSDDTD